MALSKRLSLKRHADDESSEATSIKGSSKAPIPGSVLKRRNKGLSFLAMLGLGSLLLALLVLSTQIAALRDNHPLASFFGLGKEKTNKPTHSKLFKYFKKESKEHKKPAPPKKVAATNDYFDGAKSRIVAVGDFHGDWDSTFSVLKMAGLVDESENWIAGKTRFVQTGDIVDRGPDTIRLYRLMMKLTKQAKEAGGAVFSLLGNHEIMNMMEDLRYVDPGDTDSFGGEEKRKEAWSKDGWLGQYLRSLNITVQVDETVFVHGGIHPDWAKFGVESLNKESMERLAKDSPDELWYAKIFHGAMTPIWFRGYAQDDEDQICQVLDRALEALNAHRMVIGHTPQLDGHILPRCQGKVFVIDVGISRVYGGNQGALDILPDGSVRALYPNKKPVYL